MVLGEQRWEPADESRGLADALRRSVDRPGVVDLIVFGSQARGGMTGFSDVDAILVVEDDAADDPKALRGLRARVVAAQRAVLGYQPMQHHAFEVTTPRLLATAAQSSDIPAIALTESRSLLGRRVDANFEPVGDEHARARLADLVGITTHVTAWPRHPWLLHGLVSMFELLPALYLQALGRVVPKWRSFAEAREGFGEDWRPYDVLEQVRATWPRRPRPALRAASAALRNPWVTVALWRRAPARRIEPAATMLTTDCLEALRGLARAMNERAS
jgi:hypothetical protein